ncbi:hypothetical protein ABTK20_22520, partial [Acinetobacter baumannii]
KEATESFSRALDLFETEMLPRLKETEAVTPDIKAIDGRIDEQLRVVAKNFGELNTARKAIAKQVDQDFDSMIQSTMSTAL